MTTLIHIYKKIFILIKKILNIKDIKHINSINTTCCLIGDKKISIIVPVYNSAQFLNETLESISHQTFPYFEAIIVDDESVDDSRIILESWGKKDKRFKIIYNKHSGPGVSRNIALSYVSTDFITFIDSDDKFLPYALEEFYSSLLTTNSETCVSGWYVCPEDLKEIEKKINNLKILSLKNEFIPCNNSIQTDALQKYIFNFTTGSPIGKAFSMSHIKKYNINFLSLPRSEDFYFINLAICLSKKISFLRKPVILKRNNPGSLEKTKDRYPIAFINGIESLEQKMILYDIYDKYKISFYNDILNRFAYNLKTLKNKNNFDLVLSSFIHKFSNKICFYSNGRKYFYNKYNYDYIYNLLKNKN